MKKAVIVIPAHNEEKIIKQNVEAVLLYLKKTKLPVKTTLIVAENGSKDKTVQILKSIRAKNFSYLTLASRSKSQAIKDAWAKLDADYYIYMDADLSTDINQIKDLVAGLEEGYDIVLGSRWDRRSKVKRTMMRSIISFFYKSMIRILFSINLNDFQCGFKGVNKKVREKIVPKMKHITEGFMDTEMLLVAHNKGYKIKEIPVNWEDTRKSKFNIFRSIYVGIVNSLKIKRDLLSNKYD